MTADKAREYVLRAIEAGPRTAGELLRLARLTGDADKGTYRAIDRALQHHRRAGRIAFRHREWVKASPRRAKR